MFFNSRKIILAVGFAFAFLIYIIFLSAENDEIELRAYFPLHNQIESLNTLGSKLVPNSRIKIINASINENKSSVIEKLSAKEIDLAVVANSTKFKKGVSVVLPVYRGVLHVLIRENSNINSLNEVTSKHSIYIHNNESVGKEFVNFIANRKEKNANNLSFVNKFKPGKTDVIILFAPILSQINLFKGYKLLSFGEVESLGKGSKIEAINYLIPQMEPFVIPEGTYPHISGNDKPIVTIAVDMLLVTHNGVNRKLIKTLAEVLMANRAELSTEFPALFYSLTDQFDVNKLNFPLHPGAKDFIERKQPSLIERYAETINMLVYVVVLITTASIALIKINHRRKKERIDIFYERLFTIRDKLSATSTMTEKECQQLLIDIEREAFQLMMDEKIDADSSFLIFENLLHDTMSLAKVHFDNTDLN